MTLKDHIAAERQLLAALQHDHAGMRDVREEHFSNQLHRDIFRAMRDAISYGEKPSIIELAYAHRWPLDIASEISSLTSYSTGPYLIAVKQNFISREMARISQEREKHPDPLDQLVDAQTQLATVLSSVSTGQGRTTVHEEFVASLHPDRKLYKTFFPVVDNFILGFEPGDYVLIAARPSVGKTAFACSLGWNMARFGGYSVDYHSYEMQRDRIRRRVVANMASIDTRRMKKGGLTDEEYRQCVSTSELVDEYPFNEFNSAGVNIENLCMQIRASKADIIIVDYLGCVPATVTGNKTHMIGQVTNELRSTAKRTGKVLIALVQLNRESARQATEPDLHDLRDSGELEQDADVVCFLYDPQAAEHYQQGALDIRVELLFKKMRDGEIGRRTLSFNKPYSRFYDLVPDTYHDPQF